MANSRDTRIITFLKEAKRRRVYIAVAAYVALGIGLMELAEHVEQALLFPPWTSRLVTFLLILGLPMVAVLAWIFDVGSQRVARAAPEDPAPAATGTGRRGTPPVDVHPASPSRFAWRNRPMRWALGLSGVILLAVFLLGPWWGSHDLDPRHVVVAPFENRTGEPSLDPVGSMAADWITQGIQRVPGTVVVFGDAARAAARRVSDPGGTEGIDVDALAKETGAGLVVSGSFYLTGDSLQFQAQITDARRRRLRRALEPLSAPRANPMPAIEGLRQHTLSAVAALVNTRLGDHDLVGDHLPDFEAYIAYMEGDAAFLNRRYRASIEYYEHAAALDTGFLAPRLRIAIAYWNLRDRDTADSITRALNGFRDRLAPYDRALLDLAMTWPRDDRNARYEAAKRVAEFAPNTIPHVQWGAEAFDLNRPGEAIEILSDIDPTRGEIWRWRGYWMTLTGAHHILGHHRRELQVAHRAHAMLGNVPRTLLMEGCALVALGRLSDVESIVDRRASLADQRRPDAGTLMLLLGDELHVHGHEAAAKNMYDRAIRWNLARPDSLRDDTVLAHALVFAGRRQEAEVVLRVMAAKRPQDLTARGLLGVLAAQSRDSAEAVRISAWLAKQRPRYETSFPYYWRAVIAANLGRREEATALLREAFSRAYSYPAVHRDPLLDPLRGYGPFDELMKPGG